MVHDDDAVAHGQRLLLIVGDVDEGDAGALLNALELDLHILAQLEVERAERLVEQQHARLADECTRDGDTLLLAAGQAGHIARLEAGKADEREHFARFQLDLGRIHLLDVQAEGDVLRNVQMGEQGVALENGVDLAAVGGHVVQTPALEQNVAAVRAAQKPPMMRRVVVLPQPDGPSRVTNSRLLMSSEMPRSTGVPSNSF